MAPAWRSAHQRQPTFKKSFCFFFFSPRPQIKEAEAERERQADVRYLAQMAAQLDKQERDRQQLLERVRAVQVGRGAGEATR